jgi:hypothetical protein
VSLQAIGGQRLGDKSVPIVCHIDKLGKDGAILKLPKGERQGLPLSVGREPRLAIPPALAKKEILVDVFAKYVSTKLPLTLEVREVINRRTGNVLGLHLEAWPK